MPQATQIGGWRSLAIQGMATERILRAGGSAAGDLAGLRLLDPLK
jgi:hypothetical protein